MNKTEEMAITLLLDETACFLVGLGILIFMSGFIVDIAFMELFWSSRKISLAEYKRRRGAFRKNVTRVFFIWAGLVIAIIISKYIVLTFW